MSGQDALLINFEFKLYKIMAITYTSSTTMPNTGAGGFSSANITNYGGNIYNFDYGSNALYRRDLTTLLVTSGPVSDPDVTGIQEVAWDYVNGIAYNYIQITGGDFRVNKWDLATMTLLASSIDLSSATYFNCDSMTYSNGYLYLRPHAASTISTLLKIDVTTMGIVDSITYDQDTEGWQIEAMIVDTINEKLYMVAATPPNTGPPVNFPVIQQVDISGAMTKGTEVNVGIMSYIQTPCALAINATCTTLYWSFTVTDSYLYTIALPAFTTAVAAQTLSGSDLKPASNGSSGGGASSTLIQLKMGSDGYLYWQLTWNLFPNRYAQVRQADQTGADTGLYVNTPTSGQLYKQDTFDANNGIGLSVTGTFGRNLSKFHLFDLPPAPVWVGGSGNFGPPIAIIGSTVILHICNVTGATVVTVNGIGATFTVLDDCTIIITVPPGVGSGGPVCVTTPGGTTCSANNLIITSTYGPQITQIQG